MEEILASIRKIIEDNDSARPATETSGTAAGVAPFPRLPSADPFAFAEAEEDEPPFVISPDNINSNPKAASRPAEWGMATARQEPVRHEPLRQESARQASAPQEILRSEPLRVEVARAPAGPVSSRPAADPKPILSELRPTLHDRTAPMPVAETAPTPQAIRAVPVAPVAPPASTTPVAARAIVSPTTIKQVSAAFDDLNHAVEAETRRTFDEIAEEILRPMLQEWLDDNLPRLVERLVREEIQRVARGSRA
jgi:uncharacterized protein